MPPQQYTLEAAAMYGRASAAVLVALLSLALAHASTVNVLSQEDTLERYKEPWFCHGLDCPHFKVLNRTSAYELRQYGKSTWVQTTTQSVLYSYGVAEGFQRLFKYISGANEEEKKINMTVPVDITIVPGSTFSKSNYTTHFFVPYKYQGNPPTPTNPDVTVEHWSGGVLAVIQFGGFVVEQNTLTSKRDTLAEALKADGIEFEDGFFTYCGYDNPTRLSGRHNEVMLLVKSGSTKPAAEEIEIVA